MDDSGLSLARQARFLIRSSHYREAFQVAARARDQNPKCAQAYVAEGMALFGLGKYDESLAALAEGLSAVPTDQQLLKTIIEVALKSPLKSEFVENLSRLEESNLSGNAFVICSLIGQDLHRVEHHQAAIDVLESALEIDTNSPKLRGSVLACLGSAYWAVGERDSASRNMKEELVLCRENSDVEGEVRALGNLAAAARECGHLSESISCLRDQIRASRNLPEQQSQASLILAQLTNTEMALQTLEKFGARAQSFIFFASKMKNKSERRLSLERAVSVASKLNDNNILVRALLLLGQVLLELKEHKEAIDRVEHARQIINKSDTKTFTDRNNFILEASATLATCYRAVGNHRKTITIAHIGVELARKINNPDVEFHCLGEEGRAYQSIKEWQHALNAFTSQRELLSLSSLPIAWADCLLGIVDCLEGISKSYEAIEVLLELVDKCDREYKLQLQIFNRLARFQEEVKLDYRGAIRSTESLLFAAIKENDVLSEKNAYRNLGRLHLRLNHLQAAERCLEKALRLDHNKALPTAAMEVELANIAFQLKNFQKARSILQHHHDYFALYILAQIEEEAENYTVAIDLYKSILGGCLDNSIKESTGSKLAKCLQKMNKHDEAVQALRDVVRDIRETESVPSEHQSAHSLNRTNISSIHSTDSSTTEKLHLSLVLTLAESLAAIGKIDEALDEAKQAGELGSSLRELLLVRMGKLQEALVERVPEIRPGLHFSLCRLDLHCWLVNEYNQVAAFCGQSGASEQLLKLKNVMMSELSPRLDTSDSSCDSNEERMDLFEASSYLYDALISPFECELRKEQSLQIYCHDERLMSIPWPALSSSVDSDPLFQKYKLSIIPSSCNVSTSQAGADAKIVHIQTLETKEEINTSGNIMQSTSQLVVSNLKELLSIMTREQCIWLSLDMQSSCELQLADQKLNVTDMFEMVDLSHILLVVLDSNNSSIMAKALINAGVKCVIHPLWKLPKTAIRELIMNISSNLESMDPISAMQDAQLKQKNGKQFKDSSFWSAWIAIGMKDQNETPSLLDALYSLLRQEPDRSRRTLLQVQLGEMPLSNDDKLNEQFTEEFSALVPSLLTLPIETLSTLVPLLPKRKMLYEIKKHIDHFLHSKEYFHLEINSWSIPGCHDFLLSLGLDVVEMNATAVSLVGGNDNTIRLVHRCLCQLLLESPSSSPEQTTVELVENSPIVSETSSTSPLRHSDSSPFRVVQRKSKIIKTDAADVAQLTEVISNPEMASPKRPVVEVTGRSSLPPMQHKFRSLWLDEDDLTKHEEDRSSGFGSGDKQ